MSVKLVLRLLCCFLLIALHTTNLSAQENKSELMEKFAQNIIQSLEDRNINNLMELVWRQISCYDGSNYDLLESKFSNVFNQCVKMDAQLLTIDELDETRFQIKTSLKFSFANGQGMQQYVYFVATEKENEFKIVEIYDETEYKAINENKLIKQHLMSAPGEELTAFQRAFGFVRLWSEVKYNFALFDRVPDIDWDSILYHYLPEIQENQTTEEYYRLLQKIMALLQDAHTGIWYPFKNRFKPPLRIMNIQNKAVIVDVGTSKELEDLKIIPGLEITKVDGRIVSEILTTDIFPYISASTIQFRDIVAYDQLLQGPKNSACMITIKTRQGKEKNLTLTRLSKSNQMPWLNRSMFEFRKISNDISYVALNSFQDAEIVNKFDQSFNEIQKAKGLILDLRNNGGGSTSIGNEIIGRLIDKPLPSSHYKTPQYMPISKTVNRDNSWYEGELDNPIPKLDNPYFGPIVILIGPRTGSAAEDCIISLHAGGRAKLVGEKTSGSTGQPLTIRLPGGGNARICTIYSTYPDGKEFVGVGIKPDVEIHPTQEDFYSGHDRVLEEGIKIIKKIAHL
jgi:C-terminal processing protease CtpA/Prc